jgi:FMN phosphatase YigB (HAD superfamily)
MRAVKSGSTSAAVGSRTRCGFEATRIWILDLDNTLYPGECNLFAQVDHRMGEFIADYLDVPYAWARHLRKSYYRRFGTTLSGLMQVHKMAPEPIPRLYVSISICRSSPSIQSWRGPSGACPAAS